MKKLLVIICALALCSCRDSSSLVLDVHASDEKYMYVMRDVLVDSIYVDSAQNVHFFGKSITGIAPLKDCYIRR